MGIEIIKITDKQPEASTLKPQDLARVSFSVHSVPTPSMSIWLMSMPSGQAIFPWWNYEVAIDGDVNQLSELTGISSPQGLFDFLFLHQLKRTFSTGLYTLVPGNAKTEGAQLLNESAETALSRGQNCVYRLEAAMGKKLAVNWVPFYQPQVMVKDVSGDTLNRFFRASRTEDVTNSLSFVGLADVRRMAGVVNLLVKQDENRSEHMTQAADWFGVYSSPTGDTHGTCAMVYTSSNASVAAFVAFQKQFEATIEAVRANLFQAPMPSTVLKIASRLIAL
jgi:hypothetical protein